MVIKSEQLLETVLDLERSRQRERDTRLEAEALLEGLRGMSGAQGKEELFAALVQALRSVIDFDQAFILQAKNANSMTVLATTCATIQGSQWEIGPVFGKALSGKPVASFDIAQVPEWQQLPAGTIATIRSALHIGLSGSSKKTLLIVTHQDKKHFGPSHVKKARRFSPLASQALLTLELRNALIERDRFYQLSLDAMAIFTLEGALVQQNQSWRTAFDDKDTLATTIFALVHPEELEPFQEVINQLHQSEESQIFKTRLLEKSGNYSWFSCSIAVYADQMMYYIVARNIHESVLFEQKLAYQAGHDSLTGLKNRAEFMESLKSSFSRFKKNKEFQTFALLFLDLNKFKQINDTLGHDIGDELLKAFALTLQDVVRGDDVVSRLGGDEFTIILSKINSIEDAKTVADRIQTRCQPPYVLKGHTIQASTSIGIALCTPDFTHEEEIIHAADLAMYNAKQDKSLPYSIHQGPLQCNLVNNP
nr:GGDEF domain-containing protein [uncultured Desulfobulbus sp.]